MKKIRKYEITKTEWTALKELLLINGTLEGLTVCSDELGKYRIEVYDDDKGWDTIVDGKNLLFHMWEDLSSKENNVSEADLKNEKLLRKWFKAMKSVCNKDIDAWTKTVRPKYN